MADQHTRTTPKQNDKAARQPKPKPPTTMPAAESVALQRALDDPFTASPEAVLAAQKFTGNRAVSRLIQTKLAVGPAGDQYEQEADQVAEQVMTMPTPAAHQPAVQRHTEEEEEVQRAPEEEDELQMKPLAASITPLVQRAPEEEEEIQAKPIAQRAPEEEDELQMKPLVQRAPEEEEIQTKPIAQRAPEEEEELQMKPLVQRAPEEEEEIQTKPIAQRAPEEEDELQMKPLVQRAPEEEEEIQTKPIAQRAPEEEEELQMKRLVQRAPEEEELQMKPLVQRAPEEEDELQMKPLVQRAPEEEEEIQTKPIAQRAPEEEEELQAKPEIQRAANGAGFEVGGNFEQQLAASRGGGQPLPDTVRDFMEPRFGTDFSGVRIHTGSQSAQLNRSVSAQAFTLGRDIYLGEGKDDVESSTGKSLLAHELTHVVQQTGPQLKAEEEEVQRLPLAPEHIQRHGSAEHMLLGEVNPQALADSARAKVPTENRLHALHQELRRARTWHQKGPLAVQASDGAQYQVRMVCIGRDKNLWLTYGELNAMPDYVSSPDALENGETEMLSKLIQHVRFESARWIREQVERIVREERETIKPIRYDMVGGPPAASAIPVYSEVDQKRLAALRELENQEPGLGLTELSGYDRAQNLLGPISSQSLPLGGAAETMGLDKTTSNMDQDKYSNLLGRNACHFAPYSWDRWLQFHNAARATALKAFSTENETEKTQLYNSALIQNGYADHFLQDSFAAGHLINKTLVMQWYVEWMNTKYAEIARSQLAETAGSLGQSAESTSQWGQQTQKSWQQSAESTSQWGQQTQKSWQQSAESTSQWGQETQKGQNQSAESWSQWGQQRQAEGTGFWGSLKGLAARAAGGTMWALHKGVGGLARGAGGVGWGVQEGVGGLARGAGGVGWGVQEGVGGLARGAGGVGWGAQKAAQGVVSGASTVAGIPMPGDWDQIKNMTQAQQPGLADMRLYEGPFRQRQAGEASDPQTAQEQSTAQERMVNSGVKGGWKGYQDYLTFLKKSSIQLASSRLHDFFCKQGLTVSNNLGDAFKVYGDYNLLNTGEDVAQGVLIASTAAQMSRQAIEEIAEQGNTENNAEQIFARFPQTVTHPGGSKYSLADWHGGADMPGPLKAFTIANIFEPMWQTVWNNALPDMDKISQDAGAPLPHEPF